MKEKIITFLVLLLVIPAIWASGSEENANAKTSSQPDNTITVRSASGAAPASNNAGYAIIERDMSQLERLYKYVEKNYLYEVDHDKIYNAMATALFESLDDTYSYYVKPEKSSEYEEQAFGKYGGLGIYFSKGYLEYQNPEDKTTLYCNITQVFSNTPASRSGLIVGDLITHIDGEDVSGKTSQECASVMKGTPGSAVKLTILRNDTSFDVEITRAVITVPTVEYTMIDDITGYIIILEFSPSTSGKIHEAIADLMGLGMQNLIIDLRNNPGGDVDETLKIADMFISDKSLLTVSYKDSSKDKVYVAGSSTFVPDSTKVVILVNGGSASSSEIFASTMRDNGRAILIGTKTFGKGIMQMISSFGDGYTSLTAAGFVPPSGNPIHKQGVMPDIEIESVIVEKEDMETYLEFLKSKVIRDFVNMYPDYTPDNTQLFLSRVTDVKLPDVIKQTALRNEYYSRMQDPPIFDMELDPQLEAAYMYINGQN